jgi:hypothetical protein
MDSTSQLIWGFLFGVIGLGFFTYGRRQSATIPLLSGIGLFVFPYFVSNVYLMVLTGVALVVLPFLVRI